MTNRIPRDSPKLSNKQKNALRNFPGMHRLAFEADEIFSDGKNLYACQNAPIQGAIDTVEIGVCLDKPEKHRFIKVIGIPRNAKKHDPEKIKQDAIRESQLAHRLGIGNGRYIKDQNKFYLLMHDLGSTNLNKHLYCTKKESRGTSKKIYVQNPMITPDERVQLSTKAIMQVYICHKLGIVHRDIKPSNFAYDPNTKDVRLVDLGFAVDIIDVLNPDIAYIEGCTPGYHPPHDIYNDKKTDLHALAMTIIEILGVNLHCRLKDIIDQRQGVTLDNFPELKDVDINLKQTLQKALHPLHSERNITTTDLLQVFINHLKNNNTNTEIQALIHQGSLLLQLGEISQIKQNQRIAAIRSIEATLRYLDDTIDQIKHHSTRHEKEKHILSGALGEKKKIFSPAEKPKTFYELRAKIKNQLKDPESKLTATENFARDILQDYERILDQKIPEQNFNSLFTSLSDGFKILRDSIIRSFGNRTVYTSDTSLAHFSKTIRSNTKKHIGFWKEQLQPPTPASNINTEIENEDLPRPPGQAPWWTLMLFP